MMPKFIVFVLFLWLSFSQTVFGQQALPIQWGVGGPTAISSETQYIAAFKEMRKRGLTTYRFQINLNRDLLANLQNTRLALRIAKLYGIELKPLLMLPFHWEDEGEGAYVEKKSADQLYADAYRVTYGFVSIMRNEMHDWELGNEINLRTRFDNGGKDLAEDVRWNAKTFDTPRMKAWSAALRGQSDAIRDVNSQYGTHLRRVLNTTMLQMGFVDFMLNHGVDFEVISYHLYAREGADLAREPNGLFKTVNLFEVLARYKRPIIINEINCAEIYDKRYENREGGRLNDECLRSLDGLLTQIATQKIADIEGIQVYTLIDLPKARNKAEQEFGLMYDLDKPKLGLAVLARHAGGEVEPDELRRLNLLGIN